VTTHPVSYQHEQNKWQIARGGAPIAAEKWPQRVQGCVGLVLKELADPLLLILRNEPKLEVMVRPEAFHSVWAYFPIRRGRPIPRQYKPRVATRLLLVISEKHFAEQSMRQSQRRLRYHFGQVLLYLSNPTARNDCPDAMRERRASCA
jgi:hypothetical protein